MEEKRDNSGVLFKNDKKEEAKHPDYKGNIKVGGQEYWISAWIKEGKSGKFMSLAMNPRDARQEEKPVSKKIADMEDDIPFN